MSTRGIYGFRKDGMDKVSYNHFDSYPNELGRDVAGFCAGHSIDELNEMCDNIRLVKEEVRPDYDEWRHIKSYFRERPEEPDEKSWYGLLLPFQGNLDMLFDYMKKTGSAGYMTDSEDFIKDSLFCEYGYIINLDTGKLEMWEGAQKEPDPENRYGTDAANDMGYYPCALKKEFSLRSLCGKKEDAVKNAVFAMNREKWKDLIEFMHARGWSAEVKPKDRSVYFWRDLCDDLIFSAEFDGTEYDLARQIVSSLKDFDAAAYVRGMMADSDTDDIDMIRTACDEAEETESRCSELADAVNRNF